MSVRILLVASDVFIRRFTPALSAFVPEGLDFRILDINRPLPELRKLIRKNQPAAIITEWLPKVTDAIRKLGFPTVIGDIDEVFPGAVSIDVDDRGVGQTAARFFVEAGYRHYGCVYLKLPYARQRYAGFQEELAKHQYACRPFLHVPGDNLFYMESSYDPSDDLKAWLIALPKPVAVFAVHDPAGRLVCEAAMEAGLLVPEEVAVIGANDDHLVCGLSFPPLSSVAIPWDRVGAEVGTWARVLAQGGKAPRTPIIVQSGPVIVRQSTTVLAVDDAQLRRSVQWLRDHFREGVTIEQMCETLRVSRRLIERKFVLHLRTSPWKFLCRLRVEAAKTLLTQEDLSMAQVAERCGFANAERFSVVFRRGTGLSPSRFRVAARAALS